MADKNNKTKIKRKLKKISRQNGYKSVSVLLNIWDPLKLMKRGVVFLELIVHT